MGIFFPARICGLRNSAHLNGMIIQEMLTFDSEKGKFGVLCADGKERLLKPCNIIAYRTNVLDVCSKCRHQINLNAFPSCRCAGHAHKFDLSHFSKTTSEHVGNDVRSATVCPFNATGEPLNAGPSGEKEQISAIKYQNYCPSDAAGEPLDAGPCGEIFSSNEAKEHAANHTLNEFDLDILKEAGLKSSEDGDDTSEEDFVYRDLQGIPECKNACFEQTTQNTCHEYDAHASFLSSSPPSLSQLSPSPLSSLNPKSELNIVQKAVCDNACASAVDVVASAVASVSPMKCNAVSVGGRSPLRPNSDVAAKRKQTH